MRDVPQGETWQRLKKGGTSGIYVVIMGLSWLIGAEQSERSKKDTDTWTVVEDISWVIQQIKKGMKSKQIAQKRARDGEAEIFTRKMYVLFFLNHPH